MAEDADRVVQAPDLPDGHRAAGKQYLHGLRKLGLDPEGLMWLHDRIKGRFVLLMVWSGLDEYGPLEISKLLFGAYRASALTREIDPLDVLVMSQKIHMANAFLNVARKRITMRMTEADSDHDMTQLERLNQYTLNLDGRGVLVAKDAKRPDQIARDWQMFRKNVNDLVL